MTTTVRQGLATVDFARPAAANSLRLEDWRELKTTFEALHTDDRVRLVVLTGRGDHFCAGMDLSVLNGLALRVPGSADKAATLYGFIQEVQACVTAIEGCGKPVLAAIQGACIGGGVAIATACDFRVITPDAHFCVKEVDFGIVPDIGTLQRLPNLIGPSRTMELSMTARKVLAEEALAFGLADNLREDQVAMLAYAQELAATLAQKPAEVITGIKRQVQFAVNNDLVASLDAVAAYSSRLMATKL